MKTFTAMSIVALMLLAIFAVPASAADTVEIRSSYLAGANFEAITADGPAVIDAGSFAGFYYDLDDDITTEDITILDGADTKGLTIGEGQLVYNTKIMPTKYAYDAWGSFGIEGFFAEDYVPLAAEFNAEGTATTDGTPDKLAKLILDSDDKYTVRTGEKLDLGAGYALEAKQVDVDGNKVWIEFTKDGEYVDDEVIDMDEDKNWFVELDDIEDEDDVEVLKVHVNQVFQGAEDSIAQIDGLWLIDYANAMTIEDDDEFNLLDNVKISPAENEFGISIKNDDSITLKKDSDKEVAEGITFRVADDNDELRFYIFVEVSEPGTYEVRGSVARDAAESWTAKEFAGFYYDLDDNTSTEELTIADGKLSATDNIIDDEALTYSTKIMPVDYAFEAWNQFGIEGFFAEEYVPISADITPANATAGTAAVVTDGTPDKLAKLILDSDDKYTIRTGEKLDLGAGYALEAKQVDVDGNKVWVEFTLDGEYVDDEVIDMDDAKTWSVELDDIEDEDDVEVLKVHVNQVFQGAEDSIAQIDGLWLIDYANAMTIEDDDEFGNLDNVKISPDGNAFGISITNDDSITLKKDSDKEIGEGMFFKVADTEAGALRYYPYVERVIGGEVAPETPDEPEVTPEEPAEPEEPAGNETVAPEEPAEPEEPTTEEPAAPEEPEKKSPGFELAFAVAGLLSVVYLVRRN